MPVVVTHKEIKASRDAIYAIIKDMEAYPRFMTNLKEVKVLERGEGYTISHWDSDVDGRRISWTERDTFQPEQYRIGYKQTEGDLKVMEGEWEIKETATGADVYLTVNFEFGIPMIACLLNPVIKRKVRDNSEAMLRAIKEQVEK